MGEGRGGGNGSSVSEVKPSFIYTSETTNWVQQNVYNMLHS